MNKRAEADRIVKQHVLWAIGAGLIPIPVVDFAAVTGIQIDMLSRLATIFEVDHESSTGKTFVAALTGTTFARIGASMVKAIPGIGSVIGGVSMSIMSGASTYAVAQVAIENFRSGRPLEDIDMVSAEKAYRAAYDDGKDYASALEDEGAAGQEVFEKLERLGRLKEKGVLTEEEFLEQKKKLLDQL